MQHYLEVNAVWLPLESMIFAEESAVGTIPVSVRHLAKEILASLYPRTHNFAVKAE